MIAVAADHRLGPVRDEAVRKSRNSHRVSGQGRSSGTRARGRRQRCRPFATRSTAAEDRRRPAPRRGLGLGLGLGVEQAQQQGRQQKKRCENPSHFCDFFPSLGISCLRWAVTAGPRSGHETAAGARSNAQTDSWHLCRMPRGRALPALDPPGTDPVTRVAPAGNNLSFRRKWLKQKCKILLIRGALCCSLCDIGFNNDPFSDQAPKPHASASMTTPCMGLLRLST